MPLKLFVVHGMGDQEENWSISARDLLAAEYEKHRAAGMPEWKDLVSWHEIRYADIFIDIIQDWKQSGDDLWPLLQNIQAQDVRKYAERLKMPAAPGFLLTHATDVILYHTCPQVKQPALNRVIKAITDEVGPGDTWAIVGHSLGTSLVHDAVHQLWNVQEQFGSVLPKASFVFMVANVSRALEWTADVYLSHVKPAPLNARQTACVRYVNVEHKFDPFPKVKRFQPVGWSDFLHVETDHFADRNIHGFMHYLAHPAVHCELLRRIVGLQKFISKVTEATLTEAYLSNHSLSLPTVIEQITKISKASGNNDSSLGVWMKLWEAVHS
jgi:hypothetical protein